MRLSDLPGNENAGTLRPCKGLLGTETAYGPPLNQLFSTNGRISGEVLLGTGYWIVSGLRSPLAHRVSVASDFSFYRFEHLRDMTGMAKPTVVSKDSFIGTMPPHLRFDTHHQRRCPSFRHPAFRGLRGGLPPRTAGPNSSRQTAVEFAAIPRQFPTQSSTSRDRDRIVSHID